MIAMIVNLQLVHLRTHQQMAFDYYLFSELIDKKSICFSESNTGGLWQLR